MTDTTGEEVIAVRGDDVVVVTTIGGMDGDAVIVAIGPVLGDTVLLTVVVGENVWDVGAPTIDVGAIPTPPPAVGAVVVG